MAWLKKLLNQLSVSAYRREQERYEAYLSEAVDLYELEHRQRAWDRSAAQDQRSWALR